MKKKLTTVDFRGTAEQEAKLLEVIAKYDGVKGKLMPILQEAQEIYGYLPVEVQKIIAEKTGTPAEQIYGVVSFYSQFKLNPDGELFLHGEASFLRAARARIDRSYYTTKSVVFQRFSRGIIHKKVKICIGVCSLTF